MADAEPQLSKFIAGNLALDFANSVRTWDGAEALGDHWSGYDDLLAWGEAATALSAREARQLKTEAARKPREAARVLGQARELRRVIHDLFAALAKGARPSASDLQALDTALAGILPHQHLTSTADGFAWQWDNAPVLDRMLWPVLRAAGDLLVSDRLARIRECGGERCGWLFLDETKNHSRRWCEMGVCGNRAKARRHYDRSRGEGRGHASRARAEGSRRKAVT
jgi:predicted RNA-binding Zn ribbon-like protein